LGPHKNGQRPPNRLFFVFAQDHRCPLCIVRPRLFGHPNDTKPIRRSMSLPSVAPVGRPNSGTIIGNKTFKFHGAGTFK
jgi:hypothetical protein